MSATINIKNYEEIASKIITLKKEQGINIPMFVWGKHGVGKTEVTRQIAEANGCEFVVLNLANQSTEDLLGYPDGKGGFILPDWFMKETKKSVVYFLDEINRAPKYVLQSMFNFINEGRIHNHHIKKDDVIIVAGNPDGNEYDVTGFDDMAWLSRFGHFYLTPSIEEFVKYLDIHEPKDVEKRIGHSAVIKAVRDSMDTMNNSVGTNEKIVCTPNNRSIFKITQMLEHISDDEMAKLGVPIMQSMVGADFATTIYTAWRDIDRIPSAESVYNTKNAKEFKFNANSLDVIAVINNNLAKYITAKVPEDLTKAKKTTVNRKLRVYLDYIPKDSAVSFVTALRNASSGDYVSAVLDLDYVSTLLGTKVNVKPKK